MFNPVLHSDGTLLGHAFERDNIFYFFGSRFMTRERLALQFPNFEFCFLKQVHGSEVVIANPALMPQADAQMTQASNLAIVIQTADCVPILVSSADQVCAIHAGWRGLAQNILSAVQDNFSHFHPNFAAIGPHIGGSSFEIGRDVARILWMSSPSKNLELESKHHSNDKTYFNLERLAQAQLRSTFGAGLEINSLEADTFSDPTYHSYRRDGAGQGRQFSFVVIR